MIDGIGSGSIIFRYSLTFYTSVAKVSKIKVRKFFGANSYVSRTYSGKVGMVLFLRPTHPPSLIGLRALRASFKK